MRSGPTAAALSDNGKAYAQGVLRRQREFDSAAAAFQRFRAAPAFADWSEGALWAYVRHGFETLPDDRVRLLCRPEIEAAMLGPIFEAMEQVYAGDERGNPFAWLSAIECPVRVATAEKSWPIYKEMAARAVALIPGASQWTFEGVGHCVAQEAPGHGARGIGGVRGRTAVNNSLSRTSYCSRTGRLSGPRKPKPCQRTLAGSGKVMLGKRSNSMGSRMTPTVRRDRCAPAQ